MKIKQLDVIEGTLKEIPGTQSINRELALSALAELRAMVEKEGGEEKRIQNIIDDAWGECLDDEGHRLGIAALSRLSLKAKLSEAALAEAKREVLKDLKQKFLTRKNYANTWAVYEIDQQLSTLDGKDKESEAGE